MTDAAPLVAAAAAPAGEEAASAPAGASEGSSAAKTALMEAAATRTAREIFFMSMASDRRKRVFVTENKPVFV